MRGQTDDLVFTLSTSSSWRGDRIVWEEPECLEATAWIMGRVRYLTPSLPPEWDQFQSHVKWEGAHCVLRDAVNWDSQTKGFLSGPFAHE